MTKASTARWATKPRVAIAAVLAIASIGSGLYALAAGLAAPTITSKPPNPTNLTSATFAYSHQSNVTFKCKLDTSGFSPCGSGKKSSKTYTGLLPGSHAFQVQAVLSSQTSSAASYTWTIDLTAPSVVSINRLGTTPTNAPSVSWTVTFNDNVTGVDTGDFALAKSPGGIQVALGTSSGSGAAYTVMANVQAGQAGTVGLNLVDNDSIKDTAGNKLGGSGNGNGNFAGQTYAVDRIVPPQPVITQHPAHPSPTRESTLAWTDSEVGVTFQCRIDNDDWHACSSPYSFTVGTSGDQQHHFTVRAVDSATNLSIDAAFNWKVSDDAFAISGDVCCLHPGTWRSVDVTITNPNNQDIELTQVSVAVADAPAGCPASWTEIQQSPISPTHTVTVPADSTIHLAEADRPQIRLINAPVNQDACQGQSFDLQYGGAATHS